MFCRKHDRQEGTIIYNSLSLWSFITFDSQYSTSASSAVRDRAMTERTHYDRRSHRTHTRPRPRIQPASADAMRRVQGVPSAKRTTNTSSSLCHTADQIIPAKPMTLSLSENALHGGRSLVTADKPPVQRDSVSERPSPSTQRPLVLYAVSYQHKGTL